MKLLSCEKKGTVYKLNLFGKEIKITIRSLERKIKDIDKRLCALEHHIFLWANAEHMTKSDRRCFVSKKFYEILGFFPDIDNPKTFFEKLHWMNENYYDPNEERCYDKLEFKKYVEERFGTGYTVNLLGGGYETVNEIDFDSLPNKFVVKNTLCGATNGVVIVKDKKSLNLNEFKYKLNNLLFNWNNGFNYSFNRVGKYSKQRLFIEEYIESCDNQVYDYKFLYFHGELKIFWIDVDRYKKHCRVFFELKDGNPVVLYNFSKIKNPYELIPKNFDKMKTLAKKAAKEFPHVRVDFYDLGDRVLFGEFTFTTNSALSYNMFPRELDEKLGECLDLTKLNPKYLLKNDKK